MSSFRSSIGGMEARLEQVFVIFAVDLKREDMTDFAAIDFETANGERSIVCSVGVVVVRGGLRLSHDEPPPCPRRRGSQREDCVTVVVGACP